MSKASKCVGIAAGLLMLFSFASATLNAEKTTWTYDYDCTYYILINEHEVRSGGDQLASGPHERIPEDCSVHPHAP